MMKTHFTITVPQLISPISALSAESKSQSLISHFRRMRNVSYSIIESSVPLFCKNIVVR